MKGEEEEEEEKKKRKPRKVWIHDFEYGIYVWRLLLYGSMELGFFMEAMMILYGFIWDWHGFIGLS